MIAEVLPPPPDVLRRIEDLAGRLPVAVDVEELLFGRAALLGLQHRGRTSAGGSCRLLPAPDGWVAVNLARPTDVEAVPAIVEATEPPADPWSMLERFTAETPAAVAAARCQLLGVPGAVLADPTVDGSGAVATLRLGRRRAPAGRPRVVDLSSMWAGPLCSRLLGLAGMQVCKVESTSRPDGARFGDPRFFAWLHEGHRRVALDLETEDGRRRLRRLLDDADVVVESTRPRALEHLGIRAEDVVRHRPGLTWVSITGYGRSGPDAARVAFGDDAAVAGGLVGRDGEGLPVFCGDAIADPLTGLRAAVAAVAAVTTGGGVLLDVSMAAVARSLADPTGN
ncbi:MAG: CoA transferase [Acidimicrobiales bacterium]